MESDARGDQQLSLVLRTKCILARWAGTGLGHDGAHVVWPRKGSATSWGHSLTREMRMVAHSAVSWWKVRVGGLWALFVDMVAMATCQHREGTARKSQVVRGLALIWQLHYVAEVFMRSLCLSGGENLAGCCEFCLKHIDFAQQIVIAAILDARATPPTKCGAGFRVCPGTCYIPCITFCLKICRFGVNAR